MNKVKLPAIILFVTVGLFFILLLITPRSNARETNAKTRVLIDASSDNFPPINLLDKKGNLIGFGKEIADAVGRAVGVDVRHIHSSHWSEILHWLDSGKADFVHDTGYTKDRDTFLDYSKPILEMPEMIFIRSDQYDITGLDSLKDKKVACVEQHISHLYLQSFPEIACHVVKTPVEGLYALISRKVDAFVYPEQIVLYLTQNLRLEDKIKIAGTPLRTLTWSMVVKEGNKELLSLLNKGIDTVRSTGEYDRIYNKWWGKKLFAGYSEREVFIITVVAVGISLIFISLIALFLYNYKLRSGKIILEKEIFQRKQTEIKLMESTSRFKEFAESLPQIVFETDTTGNLIFVNQNAFDIFGYTKEDFDKGLNALQMIIPKDHERAMENIQKILNGKVLGGEEYTALRKNGTTFPVLIHSNRSMRKDKPTGLRGMIIDLSISKEMEKNLRRQSMAMDQSTDVIVITDKNGLITYVNPAFEKTTGYSRIETIGKNPNILQSGKHDELFYHELWQTISRGNTWSGRFVNKKKDGSQYIEEATISPVFSAEGKIINYVAVKRDITDSLRLEAELHQSAKMESIGSLAGGIAHDFNNILSSIIGFTELALDEVEKNTPIEDSLQEVYTAGKRAKDLVKQILAFARQSDENRNPIQPGIIAKEVLKFIRSAIPTSIEIQQEIESDSLIMGNATQVHQVLMNLCTNAAHAMEEAGGVLNVSLKDVVLDKEDLLIGMKAGDYIEIKVSDTGVGIAPEIINSIFEPYFTTKGVGEGTGMGLAMVQGVIEGHGGKITVDSQLGKGTTFTIYLPITKKRTDQMAYVPEELPTGTERILFVDDEAPIAKMGSQILERLGYSVTTRTSSIEALELFQAKPNDFDLVVTDMTMPNLTGDQLAIELMKIRIDIPVILCTGYSKKISDETASDIGIKAFAYKPVVKADLAKTVRKVLDESKGSAQV